MPFIQQNATISGAGVSSWTTAYSSNVTAGTLLTVYVHINATATTTINTPTDTRGTVYAAANAIVRQAGIGSAQVFYGIAPSAGANTVSVGITGGTDQIYIGVMEHSGYSAFHAGNGVGGSSTTPTSPTVAVNASDLTVGFCFASGTAAAAGGATSRSTFNGDCLEDAVGASSSAFTMSPTGAWVAWVATFTASVADAGGSPFRPLLPTLRKFQRLGAPWLVFPQIPSTVADTGTNWFGSSAVAIVIDSTTAGTRKTFATSAMPLVINTTTAAVRKTFGTSSFPLVITDTTAGTRKTFATSSYPLVIDRTTAGTRKTFATSAFPLVIGTTTAGVRKTFGTSAFPLVIGYASAGTNVATKFGVSAVSIVVNTTTAATRTTFATSAVPLTITTTTTARLGAYGVSTVPIVITASSSGSGGASAVSAVQDTTFFAIMT